MAERRYSILLYTAVATAVVATFGVYRVLQNTKSKSQVATQTIVVASKDLPQGTNLARENLTAKQWPAATVPAGAFTNVDSIIGRVTNVPVYAGEAIVPGRLAPVGVAAGLEVKVPAGKRAMAVKINDVAGINGLIQPNSRVDVVVMMRSGEATSAPVAKLFMENVRVLSVGSTVQRDADGKALNATTAALEVTPQEAERLAIATNEGLIQLVLRGYGDPGSVVTSGARPHDVLGMFTPPATPAAPTTTTVSAPKERRTTRRYAAAGEVALKPIAVQQATPAAAPTPAPESLTVTIYRASQAERRSFVKPDSARKP